MIDIDAMRVRAHAARDLDARIYERAVSWMETFTPDGPGTTVRRALANILTRHAAERIGAKHSVTTDALALIAEVERLRQFEPAALGNGRPRSGEEKTAQ